MLALELDWSLVIGHWSLVIGHWSLVTGHWSLVTGHWSLVTCHWSNYDKDMTNLCLKTFLKAVLKRLI